jgi:CRP-like cAMP-binding protein
MYKPAIRADQCRAQVETELSRCDCASDNWKDLTLKDVETRLANWLVKRCPHPLSEKPATIQLTVTKSVLAAELGTVSETFSRTLAKFRQQNLVLVKGKTLIGLSPAKLEALPRHNPGRMRPKFGSFYFPPIA